MISFSRVTKRFGATLALDDVSFEAQPGSVTGFLGPNGAGKSTSLRVLLGLVRPDSGEARIGGTPYAALPNPGRAVGALLNADDVHPGRTGLETLRLACLTMGCPRVRADAVLDEVGLTEAEARRRVGTYSLGMRQRLGIAQALLGDPAVLVLDEPANGLDPQGQRWLGDLLRSRTERGGTVLLSSHQLSDVGRLAERAVVVSGGHVAGTLDGWASDHDLEEAYFTLTAGADRAA
jgi:ABC-2 type transport system ATP-binding protein